MKNTVYLCGGMRTGWQDIVIEQAKKRNPELVFLDPRSKEKEEGPKLSVKEYASWDLHAIKKSDIIFAYFEADNPSGFGLASEVGYAAGLGKTIILCVAPDNKYHEQRYINFLTALATINFVNFHNAIDYLLLYK